MEQATEGAVATNDRIVTIPIKIEQKIGERVASEHTPFILPFLSQEAQKTTDWLYQESMEKRVPEEHLSESLAKALPLQITEKLHYKDLPTSSLRSP